MIFKFFNPGGTWFDHVVGVADAAHSLMTENTFSRALLTNAIRLDKFRGGYTFTSCKFSLYSHFVYVTRILLSSALQTVDHLDERYRYRSG